MMLICEDYNENARFTQDTQGRIYFPGSSNNSLWACLLRLQSLGPKELLEDFDVLSKWIDCASWYSPSSQLTPPTDSVTCDKHHVCSAAPNSGSHAQKQLCKWQKKYDCCFPPHPICAEALWCVRLYLSKQCSAGFCYLTALQHPVGEPLCWMPLQGMVFVRAWAKATTSKPLLSLLFFFSLGIRARELCIQACNFTDLIQTRSKAYWGALVHS